MGEFNSMNFLNKDSKFKDIEQFARIIIKTQ